MIFLTKKELLFGIDAENLDEITNADDSKLDEAEGRALETIREYLRQRNDIDYELRPIVDYSHSNDYLDYQRIRLTYNSDNINFGTAWNIQLIDSDIKGGEEIILVKKPNTCSSAEYVNYVPSYYPDSEQTYITSNPDYNSACGLIAGADGSFNSGKIINYYNSDYNEFNHTITSIDFSSKTTSEINNIIGNINHFDQYLKSNQSRDFIKDDRNSSLKSIAIDIMKYELFQVVAPRQLNQIIADRFDRAINKLEQARDGKIQMNLKDIPSSNEYQNNLPFRFGKSIINRNWRY